MAEDKPWWEEPEESWTEREPHRTVLLFAEAYDTDDQLRSLARRAGLEPEAVTGLPIEQAWRSVLSQASKVGRALDVAGELLADPARTNYHNPLLRLLGDRARAAYDQAVLRSDRDTRSEEILRSGLEAITSAGAGLYDSDSYEAVLRDHRRRTAKIQGSHRALGTGVLIGDDLLLTAGHVLSTATWPPDLAGLEAVFDYDRSQRLSPAAIGTRVSIVDMVFGLPLHKAERMGTVADDADVPDTELDFAVVRLSQEMGLDPVYEPRGFYPLDKVPYGFESAPGMRVCQHPLGKFKQLAEVRGSVRPTAQGTRLRYRTNTLQGSSGAGIVDYEGALVGIHHYGGRTASRGVPFSIISIILDREHPELFVPKPVAATTRTPATTTVRPFEATVLGGYPLVDRKPLRDKLKAMATDDQAFRHLVIAGGPEAGKTYSMDFLTYIARKSRETTELIQVAPEGIEVAVINLRQYNTFDLAELLPRVAEYLLAQIGLLEEKEKLAVNAQIAKTTLDRISTGLRGSAKQWWICFDSIDEVARLRQSSVIELIGGAIELTKDFQLPIRVVLGGRQVTELLSELGVALPHQETTGNLLPEHVMEWVQAEAARLRRLMNPTDLRAELESFVADELGSSFPPEGVPPKTIALLLPAFLERVSSPGG